MAFLLCALLLIKDKGFQQKYFLVLYEIKKYIAVCPVNERQWGTGAALVICRFTCQRFLPKNPREAFGILGDPKLNQSLIQKRRIVLRKPIPKRRIGVGVGDKGQREISSTSGLKVLRECYSIQSEGRIQSLDYRYTEPIIFPDGFLELTNKVF